MATLIMTKGLPASGKTTWAKQYVAQHPGWKRINKDDLRNMLDAGKWSKSNEHFIIKMRNALIVNALRDGFNVICDDTNFHPPHEKTLRDIAEAYSALFQVQDFTHVDIDVCIERDKQRPNSVGEQVIQTMWQTYLAPPMIVPKYDPNLPDAIIVDVDGTLADCSHRSPYNCSELLGDAVIEPIAQIVRLYAQHVTILIVSGREDKWQADTETWLRNHDIPFAKSMMRVTGDHRHDAIIKQEIYTQYIQGKYNIRFVLDDRNRVVQLWRSLGLTCLQVAEGDF